MLNNTPQHPTKQTTITALNTKVIIAINGGLASCTCADLPSRAHVASNCHTICANNCATKGGVDTCTEIGLCVAGGAVGLIAAAATIFYCHHARRTKARQALQLVGVVIP